MLEVVFQIEIVNAAFKIKPNKAQCESVIIVGIDYRKIGKQPIRKQMIPTQVDGSIPKGITEIIGDIKHISAKITRKIQVVIFVDVITQFGIEVVEIGYIVVVKQRKEQMSIAASSGNEKRTFFFHQRPFQH